MAVPRLGRVQLNIMRVLWEREEATAREITEALNREEQIAHSTVQTLLRKLEVKGAVGHEARDRTFVFRPLVKPEGVRKRFTREFIDHLFEGSPGGLVSYLLRTEAIPAEELDQIRELVDRQSEDETHGDRGDKRRGHGEKPDAGRP